VCVEQGSWQPLLDRQGNVTARFDEDEGKWDLLWVDDQGDQLWAALDFFCSAAEDAPPPPTEDTASLVVEEAGPAPAAAQS
jgi:hypothetical protein